MGLAFSVGKSKLGSPPKVLYFYLCMEVDVSMQVFKEILDLLPSRSHLGRMDGTQRRVFDNLFRDLYSVFGSPFYFKLLICGIILSYIQAIHIQDTRTYMVNRSNIGNIQNKK